MNKHEKSSPKSDQNQNSYDQPMPDITQPDPLASEHAVLLSHYHSLEKIGHGAQATMLKALDNENRPVAIKVFDYSKATEWKDVELFEREIEVLKNLNINGVPKYIETIKTNSIIYLVEEYIDAFSIEKQLKNGRKFSTAECVTIMEHTAAILSKLSDHIPPIVHRDIKPANLLVDDDLNVYLVDFGVVTNTQQTISMTFAGTAGYVAPEQLYGKSSPASDIFSLGSTMLYIISRVAPCDMELNGILPNFDKYIPPTVPEWLSNMIKQMMSVNPSERPQNGDKLIEIIHKYKTNDDSEYQEYMSSPDVEVLPEDKGYIGLIRAICVSGIMFSVILTMLSISESGPNALTVLFAFLGFFFMISNIVSEVKMGSKKTTSGTNDSNDSESNEPQNDFANDSDDSPSE